jgi:NCAIR mutase (PurE)-related protein
MQNVFDNYPNTEEGKKALDVLTTQIPILEKMDFTKTDTKNWKILYKVVANKDKTTEDLEAKIKKLMEDNNYKNLFYSFDNYTETEKFITIHGINSGEYARTIALILEENEKYKIAESAIVMTNENYKVIQIKKNLDTYLAQIK